MYIDANVKIHSKLCYFFNELNKNTDLVLFSHPHRKNINQEVNEIITSNHYHKKWNLNINEMNKFKKQFNSKLKNNLYWLNIQLTNSKYNIWNCIGPIYNLYRIKRDQIYFPIFENRFRIKCVKIEQVSSMNNGEIDQGYGLLKNWSDKFSRPVQGSH